MTEEDARDLLRQLERVLKKVDEMAELLEQALPYVVRHYESSRVGFGKGAQTLMHKIKDVLGVK